MQEIVGIGFKILKLVLSDFESLQFEFVDFGHFADLQSVINFLVRDVETEIPFDEGVVEFFETVDNADKAQVVPFEFKGDFGKFQFF